MTRRHELAALAIINADGKNPENLILHDAIVANQSLGHQHWRGLSVTDTTFVNCDLTSTDFSWADLANVSFIDCDLRWHNFSASALVGCDFTNCDLFHADFYHTRLLTTTFPTSDLTNACLLGAYVTESFPVPPGYRATAIEDIIHSVFDGPDGILELSYDLDFLCSHGPPRVVDLLLREHPRLPVGELVALSQSVLV